MAESRIEYATRDAEASTREPTMHILHVDDEAGFLKAAKQILEMQGAFQVDTAASVEDAKEKMKEKAYDAIVCDYIMPRKDGLEFLKELRRSGNNIPFIIFTGKGREEAAIQALNSGADQYINKIGEPEAVYCELAHSIRQVLERKKSEKKLKETEEQMRSFMEAATEVFCIFDLGLNFSYITEHGIRTFFPPGTKKEDIIGRNILDVIPNIKETGRYDKYVEVIKTGKPFLAEDLVPHTRFGLKHLALKAFKIKDGMGVIISDVTKPKKTQEKLEMMNEKLSVVDRLSRSNAQNKLSAVRRNTLLIKQKLAHDSEALKRLGEIELACGEIGKIFESASVCAKIGLEELAYMNVEQTLEETVQLFSDLHGVKVVNNCRGLTVMADSLFRQLFYNLIDNSLKFGEKVRQIRVYCKAEKNILKLIYEDDGVGVPNLEKKKIFCEGYRRGTGYGLYLIKKMCEAYGWTVYETGKQGKGAQFTIGIPRTGENGKVKYELQ